MIKLNLDKLLIPTKFLDLKYKYKANTAIDTILKLRENKEIWFLDVDKTVDINEINIFVEENKDKYDNLIVLWMWWSALWTLAIHTALKWKNWNLLTKKQRKSYLRLFVLDNVDPLKIKWILDVIDLDKTLFIVISKSWNTIETKSLFNFFKEKYRELNLENFSKNSLKELKEKDIKHKKNLEESYNKILNKHFIIVAWESSKFATKMMNKNYIVFTLQKNIWWRFSIFTPVWLLPLAFCWININDIILWIKEVKSNLLSKDLNKNIALITALIHYHTYFEMWKNIQVLFTYIDSFNYVWEWYKQIVWESLWKWWLGATTTTATWVTDQHSQLQLYYDWPNDKLITFIELKEFPIDYNIWKYNFSDLMKYEKFWTEESISSYNKINYSIILNKLNEQALAWLLLMFEMQTAILGELYWVNPYNQPWVEIWKKITENKIKEVFWE